MGRKPACNPARTSDPYNGLTRPEPTLPSNSLLGHRSLSARSRGDLVSQLAARLPRREALADPAADIDNIVAFGTQVLEEDADICEVNQMGLRSMRHKTGVLMPEEYDLHRFHNWVRERHAALAHQSDLGR
ncbi:MULTISPECIES: SRPBCC family protein [unclassified Mesorhizobium]|uniref:SRPBCC family protein n=1 Tax=unclassified Mesorhizobium TaxID=325217 RepID=UPI0033391A43